MAPQYKLSYFDIRGIAEPIRFLFHYGGIEFEDVRISNELQWPELKNSTPFGQLPVLEHNGKQVSQSNAIARYVANQVKLAGNNDWENLEIDSFVDSFNDLKKKIFQALTVEDEDKKKALKEGLLKETVPFFFSKFEAIAKKNGGYLAVGRLTWADLYFVSWIPSFEKEAGTAYLDTYPTLKALRDKVEALPSIKKYLENRPNTNL